MSAPVLSISQDAVARAANALRAGGLVVLPTETVYGLAADAARADAVARLYAAKGRPAFNPLIAHVADLDMAKGFGGFNDVADALAAAFWPGPLTLVVPLIRDDAVCDLARAGLETVAVRSPRHSGAQAVLSAFGGPLVAPSANLSGRLSPTLAAHAEEDLSDAVDLILDGGPCETGVESTIVDCTGARPALLRHGAIAPDEIEAIAGPLRNAEHDPDAPSAPGQLLRHYAPNARLRLNAASSNPGEAFLGFGAQASVTLNLSQVSDLQEAAANLFAMLRELDGQYKVIAVAPIPDRGLGLAINDRLRRAAER